MATGAGAGAQTAIGTGVLGGMVTSTFLAIFFIPIFYVAVVQFFGRKKNPSTGTVESTMIDTKEG
jgi:HAE1 family hydrophobic/amphiphilic exporter-1